VLVDVFQAILDKLNDDSTLQNYLGSEFAFRANLVQPSTIPSITVMINTEKSTLRPGSAYTRRRDTDQTIQVDVWVSSADESFPCTGEDADLIADRIDELLLNPASPVTGTLAGSWQKTSASQQYEPETRIWHNAARYSFQYSMMDT